MAPAFPLEALIAATCGQPRDDTDWDDLLPAANQTLTTGTLAQKVLSHGNSIGVPQDVQEFLAVIHARTQERNTHMRAQLAEAVEHLNAAGVIPLLFKGAAILQSAEALGLDGRILTDLDLMVSDENLAAAVDALEALGYESEQATAWSRSVPIILARETDVGTIDLHHHAYGNFPVLLHRDLVEDATLVRLGAGEAWAPSPEKQIAVLVVHDQLRDRDYWRGSIDLRHLLDTAALAGSQDGVDWRALDAIFPAGYPKRALRTHLLTLRSLLGTEIPEDLLSGWQPRMQLRRRMLQIERPALQLPATVASLVIDPPWHSVKRIFRTLRRNVGNFDVYRFLRRFTRSASRIVKGFFQPNDLGKS